MRRGAGEVFVIEREYEQMLCVCFLKLEALLCLNHCRTAPLYTSFPSLLAF